MRRKPSASHCVKKLPFDVYRPESSVLSFGAMRVSISSVAGIRHVGDQQLVVLDAVAIGAEFLAVQRDAEQSQRLAIQRQRRVRLARRGISPHRQARAHAGRGLVEIERQLDGVDQEGRRPVIGKRVSRGVVCGGAELTSSGIMGIPGLDPRLCGGDDDSRSAHNIR